MNQYGHAFPVHDQVAAEASAETEGIDLEIGEVHQVNRIGQHQLILARESRARKVNLLPKTPAAISASFGAKHGVPSPSPRASFSFAGRIRPPA